MNKFTIVCLIFLLFIQNSFSQTYSSKELIEKWEKSDVYQTLESEKSYTDLKYNLIPKKFRETLKELNEFSERKPSKRLEIRIKMYEILGDMEMNIPNHWKPKEEISKLFKEALLLKDEQLLSELYTLYADRNYESVENRLFYLTKAIEIQKTIGIEYFPKFYIRQFLAGYSYFHIEQYKEAISSTRNCLQNLPNPETNLRVYILSLDLLGTMYDRTNKLDSSIYFYKKIHTILDHYQKNYTQFKEGYEKFDEDFYLLWKGIADGGIGRVFVKKGKTDEALPLLLSNLSTSQKYNQKNDIAKVENNLGLLYQIKNNHSKAIAYRRNAFQHASMSKSYHEMIQASKSLEEIYRSKNNFDSAYYFNDQKHLTQQIVLKTISDTKHQSVQHKLQHENLQNLILDAEQIISKQRNTRNFLLLGFCIVSLAAWYFYKRHLFRQTLKILELQKAKEISDLKLQQTEQEIHEAKQQLESFKNKLQHNQHILDNFSIENSKSIEEFPELQYLTILTKDDWENFKKSFNKVHPNYIFDLREKYPQISEAELRYICLLKLNLRPSEIASAIGISESSIRVTWHRMRKKFKIEKDLNPQEFLKYLESTT